MNQEIERKFIVKGDDAEVLLKMLIADGKAKSVNIKQAYIAIDGDEKSVWRIRIKRTESREEALWTFKKDTPDNLIRWEEEGALPVEQARAMMNHSKRVIEKTRYEIPYMGQLIEWDVFGGELYGLNIIEVEAGNALQEILWPSILENKLKDVTEDNRFRNDTLASMSRYEKENLLLSIESINKIARPKAMK
jgi:adenylate cyclase